MEAAGLYGVAAELGKKALTVLTVSDHILTGDRLSEYSTELWLGGVSRACTEPLTVTAVENSRG